MTDYLEELLDQLEEEEAGTAAHWMDALGPALFDPLSESSGSAEPEAVGRQARSPAAQRTENGLEGPPPVQAEAQGSLEAQEDVGASPASAPQEAWAAAWSPAPPEEKRSEARILGRLCGGRGAARPAGAGGAVEPGSGAGAAWGCDSPRSLGGGGPHSPVGPDRAAVRRMAGTRGGLRRGSGPGLSAGQPAL